MYIMFGILREYNPVRMQISYSLFYTFAIAPIFTRTRRFSCVTPQPYPTMTLTTVTALNKVERQARYAPVESLREQRQVDVRRDVVNHFRFRKPGFDLGAIQFVRVERVAQTASSPDIDVDARKRNRET